MNPRIRNVGIFLVVALCLAFAFYRDTGDDKQSMEQRLTKEGLTEITVSTDAPYDSFTATVANDPGCKVSGSEVANGDGLLLAGYDPSWYPKDPSRDPGMPLWPPDNVSVAQVALEHPQICST